MAFSASAIIQRYFAFRVFWAARFFRFMGGVEYAKRHCGFAKLGLEPFVKRMLRSCDPPIQPQESALHRVIVDVRRSFDPIC
jgi:hypothetical protein